MANVDGLVMHFCENYLQFIVHFLKKLENYLLWISFRNLKTIYYNLLCIPFRLQMKQVHFWNACQDIRHTDLKIHKDLVCFWLAMCRNMLKLTFTMMCLFFVRKTKPFLYCFIPKLPGGTMKAVNSASKEIKELGRRSSDEKKISLLEQPTNDRVWMFLGTFWTKVSHLHC